MISSIKMSSSVINESQTCLLCGAEGDLQSSHILPDFLFRKLGEPSGRFISASTPRRWIQAGPTARMLCFGCEQHLSRDEQSAKDVLFPSRRLPELPIAYGRWLYRFATSVSWRALTFLKYSRPHPHTRLSDAASGLLPSLNEVHHEAADTALAEWAKVIRGLVIAAPAPFEQHLVFLNGKNVPHEHPAAVGFTVYETPDAAGVFSQLGPLCLLGFVKNQIPSSWQGTQIMPSGGLVRAAPPQQVPASFVGWLADYFARIDKIGA